MLLACLLSDSSSNSIKSGVSNGAGSTDTDVGAGAGGVDGVASTLLDLDDRLEGLDGTSIGVDDAASTSVDLLGLEGGSTSELAGRGRGAAGSCHGIPWKGMQG